MRRFAAFAGLLLFLSAPVSARDLDGVMIPDNLTLTGETSPLVLNGAGYRKKFFIKVYIGALYLAQATQQAEAVLDAATARVMRLFFLRDVSQDQFVTAWNDGIAPNHSAAEMQALRARVEQLNDLIGTDKIPPPPGASESNDDTSPALVYCPECGHGFDPSGNAKRKG